MTKTNRNDPCPCGSGKKNKKCCGKDNVIAFSPSLYINELDQLLEQFNEFVTDHFEGEMFDVIRHFAEENINVHDEEELSTFSQLLLAWALFAVPIQQNKTAFDLFYDKTYKTINRPAVKRAFANWKNAHPGVFEIFPEEKQVKLIDLANGDAFETPLDPEKDYRLGDLAIGVLLPYPETHEFFLFMIQLPTRYLEAIENLLDDKIPSDLTLNDVFPQFIGDVLRLENHIQQEWNDPHHEYVARLFEQHANEKEYDQQLIHTTLDFWYEYCGLTQPTIRSAGGHAAALDYFSQTKFLHNSRVTQTQLAKEYGTSSGTISTHFRRMVDEFDELLEMRQDQSDPSPPFNMEKEMRDLTRLMEAQDFESEDDLQAFLQSALNSGDVNLPENPRDIAQDLLFDAREASGKRRKQLIEQALATHPNSPDAYTLLAEDEPDPRQKVRLLEQAIQVGEKDLGKAFFVEHKGHFWGLVETRPYMRAKSSYAFLLECLSLNEEAITTYQELLILNPNDNQGVRYSLLSLYISCEKYEEANALIEKYDEDTAIFLFNKALIHYKQNNLTKKGSTLLKEAKKSNPFVVDYLLGRKKIPTQIPDYIGLGDETEAIAYVQEQGHLWQDAIDFLKA